MFKKFLNAILFGALILGSAGTITSCKDYDDEIDEINQKLNTMTQKDELNAQVASLTSAISAAQSGAAQAATEAANALAAAKEAAGVSDQALAAAAQAGGQSGEALTAAKNAASAAETAAANTKKAADAAAAAAADAVKAAQAGAGSAAAADKASEAAGKAQAAAAEAGKTAAAAEAAAATAAENAAAANEKAEAAANEAGVSAKEAAAAKTAAAAAEAKATEAAAQAAVAKQAEAAAQAAAANALKAAANAAEAAKKAGEAETLAKAADEASKKAVEASDAANKLAGEAKDAAAAANKLADSAKTAADKAQGAADEAKKTADAAQTLAEAAKKVADAAAKQSALTELEGRVDGIEERLQKIEDNVDSLDLKTIADMIQKASDDLKVLDLISSAVTSVSIVDSYTAGQVLFNKENLAIKAGQGAWANFYWELLLGHEVLETIGEVAELANAQDIWLPVSLNSNPLDLDFTAIEEYGDWTAAQGWGKWLAEYENENPFDFYGIGANLKNAMTFKKGHQVNRPDYFVVRVSPTNAVITGDMLQLVNSEGKNLNEFVNLEVDKFEGRLSRVAGVDPNYDLFKANTRADGESETGLWIVKASLKSPYDAEKFAELTWFPSDVTIPQNPNQGSVRPNSGLATFGLATTRSTVNLDGDKEEEPDAPVATLINKILYAVQVNNTAEDAAERYVTSSYDLTFGTSVFQPANRLHYSVNGIRVEKLNNRWCQGSRSFLEGYSNEQEYLERVWLPDTVDVKPGIELFDPEKKYTANDPMFNAAYNGFVRDYVNETFNVGYPERDWRSYQEMLQVAPGETFTITLDDYQGWAYSYGIVKPTDNQREKVEEAIVSEAAQTAIAKPQWRAYVKAVPTEYAVKAIYVVLDQPNAVESIPSEWNAWLTYDYTGINEIVEGTSVDITVSGDELVSKRGDIIGFRVYAINWDGTLVDPDGRAFYVRVGEAPAESAINTVITPNSDKDFDVLDGETTASANTILNALENEEWPVSEAEEYAFDAKTLKSAYRYEWKPATIKYTLKTYNSEKPQYDENGETESAAFFPVFLDKDGKIIYTMEMGTGQTTMSGTITNDWPKIASVATVPVIPNWLAYIDDKAYAGTLTIYDQFDVVLENITITMTKVLPTTAPKGYSIKTNQKDANGVLQMYLYPDPWTAPEAEKGTMKMEEIFNFGNNIEVRLNPADYNITFANATADGKPITVTGAETLTIVKAKIDSKTKHATTVDFNYGQISTALYDAEDDSYGDYVINVDSFDTVFDCTYHGLEADGKTYTYTWHWMKLEDFQAIEGNEKKTQADLDALYTNTIQYGLEGQEQSISLEYALGVSTKDTRWNAPLSAPHEESLTLDEKKGAILISDANQTQEYFKVEVVDSSADSGEGEGEGSGEETSASKTLKFTQLSDTHNPTADVPSTLIINYKDSYGHDVQVKLPIIVKAYKK